MENNMQEQEYTKGYYIIQDWGVVYQIKEVEFKRNKDSISVDFKNGGRGSLNFDTFLVRVDAECKIKSHLAEKIQELKNEIHKIRVLNDYFD